MNNFDMSQFVTEEELEQAEAVNEEQEVLNVYDRFMFSEDTNTIKEITKNVFMVAQSVDPNNAFFEANDNEIKWSMQALSSNMAQFMMVEGLLSHRMKAGLLVNVFADENHASFTVLPGNAEILKGTGFLNGLKDMKAVNHVIDNVIKVAGIPCDPESGNVLVFEEPLNAVTPLMTGFCIGLFGLDTQQMSNLKRASKVKKTADRVQKAVNNFNTTGVALTKATMDGIVTPGMQVASRVGGIVGSSLLVGTAKSAMTIADEFTGAIARADLPHSKEVASIKSNVATIMSQYGRGNKNDSFSFEF